MIFFLFHVNQVFLKLLNPCPIFFKINLENYPNFPFSKNFKKNFTKISSGNSSK